MIISKLDAAVTQFESAIIAYRLGKLIEAITLAGAAEVMLGQMCKLQQEKAALESFCDKAKQHDAMLVENKFRDYLNKHRNWLKHFNENDEFNIEINEDDAKAMLTRATINFLRLGLMPNKAVSEFIKELI